ncbi:MAG: type IV pilus modification PilV family protein [Clostridia bacterium]|jgi:prepilin-type N-terminal cleavage/methylation domain-containing protein
MKKKAIQLSNKDAFTLVEVIISIAILALLMGPFLGLFVQITRTNKISQKTLESTFIAQRNMESLYDLCYEELLEKRVMKEPQDGYYVDIDILPYGALPNEEGIPAIYGQYETCYFHLLFQQGEESDIKVILISPDMPSIRTYTSVPERIDVVIAANADSGEYSWSVAGLFSESGVLPEGEYPVIVVNMVQFAHKTPVVLNVTGDVYGIVYTGRDNADQISYQGSHYKIYSGADYRDYSLVKVFVRVYESLDDPIPLTTMEGLIQVKNR